MLFCPRMRNMMLHLELVRMNTFIPCSQNFLQELEIRMCSFYPLNSTPDDDISVSVSWCVELLADGMAWLPSAGPGLTLLAGE